MKRIIACVVAAVSFALVSTALAQVSSSASSDPLTQERQERIQLLRTTPNSPAADATFRKNQDLYLERRAQHRQTCRADIRRANRDQKFSVLLRCMRGELTLERDFRLEQDSYLRQLSGITTPVRTAALTALKGHINAIKAVVAGIDSGVYATEDDLREARLKLEEKYRVPLSRSLTALRLDRALSWITLVLSDLPADTPSRSCLEEQERVLRNLQSGSGGGLIPPLTSLSTCLDPLTSPANSSSSSPLPSQ